MACQVQARRQGEAKSSAPQDEKKERCAASGHDKRWGFAAKKMLHDRQTIAIVWPLKAHDE